MNSFGGVWGCIGIHPGGGGRVRYGAGRQWSRFLLLLLLVCDVLKFMLMFVLVVFCGDVFCVHGFRC